MILVALKLKDCYGAGTDGTVAELKTDVTELLRTLVRGSAGALALCI